MKPCMKSSKYAWFQCSLKHRTFKALKEFGLKGCPAGLAFILAAAHSTMSDNPHTAAWRPLENICKQLLPSGPQTGLPDIHGTIFSILATICPCFNIFHFFIFSLLFSPFSQEISPIVFLIISHYPNLSLESNKQHYDNSVYPLWLPFDSCSTKCQNHIYNSASCTRASFL